MLVGIKITQYDYHTQEDPRKHTRTGSLRLQSGLDSPGMMQRPSSNEDLLQNLGPLPVSIASVSRE